MMAAAIDDFSSEYTERDKVISKWSRRELIAEILAKLPEERPQMKHNENNSVGYNQAIKEVKEIIANCE